VSIPFLSMSSTLCRVVAADCSANCELTTDANAFDVVDVVAVGVAMSAGLGGRGEEGAASSIIDVPSGNAPTRGRHVSGQDGNGGPAPYGLAALGFDGLPGLSVPALASG